MRYDKLSAVLSDAAIAEKERFMMNMSLSTIGQIAITVSDVGKALAFYQDALGLDLLFRAGPELAFLDAGL